MKSQMFPHFASQVDEESYSIKTLFHIFPVSANNFFMIAFDLVNLRICFLDPYQCVDDQMFHVVMQVLPFKLNMIGPLINLLLPRERYVF